MPWLPDSGKSLTIYLLFSCFDTMILIEKGRLLLLYPLPFNLRDHLETIRIFFFKILKETAQVQKYRRKFNYGATTS